MFDYENNYWNPHKLLEEPTRYYMLFHNIPIPIPNPNPNHENKIPHTLTLTINLLRTMRMQNA